MAKTRLLELMFESKQIEICSQMLTLFAHIDGTSQVGAKALHKLINETNGEAKIFYQMAQDTASNIKTDLYLFVYNIVFDDYWATSDSLKNELAYFINDSLIMKNLEEMAKAE